MPASYATPGSGVFLNERRHQVGSYQQSPALFGIEVRKPFFESHSWLALRSASINSVPDGETDTRT